MSDILAALGRQAENRGDATAFWMGDAALSYRALARRVAGAALWLSGLPQRIGLLAPSGPDWLIADLGGWLAGKTIVPLPHFFSDSQLRHILLDAGIPAVLAAPDQAARAMALGIEAYPLPTQEASWQAAPMRGERIVYTSGSTGAPKGVRLGAAQINHTCAALMQVVQPSAADRHLSVLPFSLLLEAICGIYLPILAGGACHICPDIVTAQGAEIAVRLGEAAQKLRPSTTVLVPQLLQAWVLSASVGRVTPPDSLRFVAVGGAAVPIAVAERAWQLGIPVHEGYGLTECGSVVAVNKPGERRAGSVGRPLPGYDVMLDADGEIIVASRSVCDGYLGGERHRDESWRTGDLGAFDEDGYLCILGRKDNLIVTPNGRNIAPEWIESMVLADPRIACCVVLQRPRGDLALLIEPSAFGAGWFRTADVAKIYHLVGDLTAAAPRYAVPRETMLLLPGTLAAQGLLTANGKSRRPAIAERYASRFTSQDHDMEAVHGVF